MSRRFWGTVAVGGCLLAGLIAAAVAALVVFLAWFGLAVLTGVGQSAAAYLAAMRAVADAVFGPAAWVVPDLLMWLSALGEWVGVIRP